MRIILEENGLFKEFLAKFGKLKNPDGSLIGKIGIIKKVSEDASPSHDDTVQLEKTQEEMTKKLEEMVNSKTNILKDVTTAVKNLETQFGRLDQIVSTEKKNADDIKERLDKIDETVLELSSLYEVVSSTVNPFVGDNQNSNEKLAEIEKMIGVLNNKVLNSNITDDLDLRLQNLESNIEDLKKIVGSNTPDGEALVEKVAGVVVERIRSIIEQKAESHPAYMQNQPGTESSLFECSNQEVRLPHLDNRPETSIILLNWIEFLMEKVGRNNLLDVLEYYVEISWISEEVSSKIIDYANGIDYYIERPTWKLLPEDHTKSLFFIEQLRGRKIDKNSLAKLERDVSKIIRGSEVLLSSNKLDL